MTSLLLLALSFSVCAAAIATASFVLVEPTSETWVPDSLNFNFAPTQRIAASLPPGQATPSSVLSRAAGVYFVRSEQDITAALTDVLLKAKALGRRPRVEVRSGRHSYLASAAIVSNGSVIDVSNMSDISAPWNTTCSVDDGSARQEPCTLVNVSGGVRLWNVYDRLARAGLVFPGGSCPSVGVAGYALGGGIGMHARQAGGLGVQNLYGARIASVVPDGEGVPQVVWRETAAFGARRGADELLWMLRGAGNNLGVVSQMTLRVWPVAKSNLGSFVRFNIAEEDCTNAFVAYESMLLNSSTCRVTPTLDLYGDGTCSLLISAQGASAQELVAIATQAGLPYSGQPYVVDSVPFVDMLSTISCGTNDTNACHVRSIRAPNPYNTVDQKTGNVSAAVLERHVHFQRRCAEPPESKSRADPRDSERRQAAAATKQWRVLAGWLLRHHGLSRVRHECAEGCRHRAAPRSAAEVTLARADLELLAQRPDDNKQQRCRHRVQAHR